VYRYSETLLDHYAHPRRCGALPEATGAGIARYPTCGDVTRIFVRIEDGVLTDASFQATGCGPGISCASALLETVIGGSVASAMAFSARAVADAIDLPESKMHCADLAVAALRQALDDDRTRRTEQAPSGRIEEGSGE